MVLGYDEFVNKIMLYIGAIEKKTTQEEIKFKDLRDPSQS